jgi:hypothetical protein
MLCADRVPIVRAHFKSAMTQTGSPDPRIDLVCITSSCPRQFLQNFGTPSSLPGLTSFNRSDFDATSLWHFDAAEQAPSTASFTTDAVEATRACVARKRTSSRSSARDPELPKRGRYPIAAASVMAARANHILSSRSVSITPDHMSGSWNCDGLVLGSILLMSPVFTWLQSRSQLSELGAIHNGTRCNQTHYSTRRVEP